MRDKYNWIEQQKADGKRLEGAISSLSRETTGGKEEKRIV
jgi:hypothetical protein